MTHWGSSHYTVTHVRNKIVTLILKERSSNVVKVISIPRGTALKGKNLLPLEANSFL